MLEILTYPPVLRGFIVLVISGFTFPITGVYLLQLNLLPLRFMLMHGAILGGAIALAVQINPFWTTLLVNLFLVYFMTQSSRKLKTDLGYISTFLMVASVGAAFIIISKFGVQAKDTMALLWGSLFTTQLSQVIGISSLAIIILLFHKIYANKIKAVFFNRSIAHSVGVSEQFIFYSIIILISLTVGFAMKMIGALLIDALIILPALIASLHAKSFAATIKWAAIWGGILSIPGFFISILAEIPVSSAIAMIAVLVFVVLFLFKKNQIKA